MGRLYKQIKAIRFKKVWLSQDRETEPVEISDHRFIAEFRKLAEEAPRSKWYHGNLKTPRYFVEIIGRTAVARGEVQPRYALFKKQRLYFPNKGLWNLIEGQDLPGEV
jgi:hypothetical protein